MKVKNLIQNLQLLDPEKEIKVVAENGLHFTPEIKCKLLDSKDVLNHSRENIEYYVIYY